MRAALIAGSIACVIAVGCLLPELGTFSGAELDAGTTTDATTSPDAPAVDAGKDATKDATPDVQQGPLYRINAGGLAIGGFVSDIAFDGGSVNSGGNKVDLSLAGDAAAPESAYQDYRFSDPTPFSYVLATDPNRPVLVRLHFADIFQTDAGARLFDVDVNGAHVLKGFDVIASAGGPNRALVRDFPTTADANGNVVVTFIATGVGNAMVAAIELYPR
jgi:hypothetical protein